MKELVEVIAKALVENPDEVVVTESVKDDETVIELSVAPADMGKVIGKQGRIAKAIRSVVKAASSKEDKKVIVEIQYHRNCRRIFMRLFFFYKNLGIGRGGYLKSRRDSSTTVYAGRGQSYTLRPWM